MTRVRAAAALLAIPLALVACAALQPHSDPTQYFVLTSEDGRTPAAPVPIVVGLDHIELPAYLKRPELVTRLASNQLAVATYEEWGEPIELGFARTLRRDLEIALGDGHVITAPFDPAHPPDVVVDVEVRRFERTMAEGAALDATWTIRDGRGGANLVSREARERVPIAGKDARASVAALSRALAALSREIAGAASTWTH